ncbi:hypothetical protein [Paracidovorax cattleyae]|uniref:Uncharacterized protein n=1 Tax=Paracidovorax cattleyae TaxID=80868 RepID=A0A1H0VNA6_9BURK|nr:hypothetical protein [Paracidovorax cattleyae]AVS75838.1 hypothetical protein C8240_19260 [Paracidovorax cattleyae]SDP79576.1 hypothetical protein SAMN04489708_12730 [Paracidovorax cattleyae]
MNLRTSSWMLGGTALLLLAAGLGFLRPGTAEESSGTREAAEAAQAARPLSADLLREYNRAGRLDGFVRHALSQPEAGGVFYAVQALRRCHGIAGTGAAAPGPASSAARAAAETLRQRCAGLSAEDTGDRRIVRLAADGLRRKDPLLAMALRAGKSAYQAPDRRQSLLSDLLAAGDPLLVQDVATRLAVRTDAGSGMRGYRFEGVFFPQSQDDTMELAFYLLPCGLGLDCTQATDWDLLARCANGFECTASRQEHVRAVLRDRPGAYERTMALYRRMLDAIRAGRIDAFA